MHVSNSTKLIVLGAPEVGKTALVIRCLSGQFFLNYISTANTAYTLKITGGSIDIVDSNGKNEALISYADGFVLVYSITNRDSFSYLQELLAKIRSVNYQHVNIVVVGTKNDKHKYREVATEEGELFASENNCLFFETSSYIPKIDIRNIFCSVSKKVQPVRKRAQSDTTSTQKHKFRDTIRGMINRKRFTSDIL